jgi:putative peptide zinc metalloprotease protein
MKALLGLLQAPKILAPAVAGLVLVGGTAVNAATGGAVVQTITGASAPVAATPAPADAAGVTATPTTAAGSTATPTASGATSTPAAAGQTVTVAGADNETFANGGGGHNVVQVTNHSDSVLMVQGRIQVNHINGSNVVPVNEAYAYSSCQHCSTIAVALQLNLYDRTANDVRPQNAAVALNYQCTGCTTVAKAYQYNIPVDDPNAVPDDVKNLVATMNGELRFLGQQPSTDVGTAESRIDGVIAQFQALAQDLSTKRQEDTSTTNPNATPQATETMTVTPTVEGSATATATATATEPTATPTPTETVTATPTASPTA